MKKFVAVFLILFVQSIWGEYVIAQFSLVKPLVFVSDRAEPNNWDMYIIPDIDVPTNIYQLTTNTGIDNHPDLYIALPPESSKIVWSSNRDGDFEIFIANVFDIEGTAQQLTFNNYPDRHPHFSHDGQRVVFSGKYREVSTPDDTIRSECSIPVPPPYWYEGLCIYTLSTGALDSLDLRNLLINGGPETWPSTFETWVGHPSFSHDGTRILFSAAVDVNGTNWEVYSVAYNSPPSNLRRHTFGTLYPENPNPIKMSAGAHYSEDGSAIYYSSTRTTIGNSKLFLIGATSIDVPVSPANQLTTHLGNDYVPEAMGDGRVVFVSDLGANICAPPDSGASDDLDIFIMDSLGTGQTNLTDNNTNDEMLLIGDEVSWFCGLSPNLSECRSYLKYWNICWFKNFFRMGTDPTFLPNFQKRNLYTRAWQTVSHYMNTYNPMEFQRLMQALSIHWNDCESMAWQDISSWWVLPSIFGRWPDVAISEIVVPSGFFDPGSEPFTPVVKLNNKSDQPESVTVVMRITNPFGLTVYAESTSQTIPIEIISLSLVSASPITISGRYTVRTQVRFPDDMVQGDNYLESYFDVRPAADNIKLLHAGLYLDDRMTPIDLLANDWQRYFVLAGEQYVPTAILRNSSDSATSMMLHCQIYGQNDSGRFIIAYDDSILANVDPYAEDVVRLSQFAFDKESGEGNYYMSWRKGDGVPFDPVPLRKGECGWIELQVTPEPLGGFSITKSVINWKDHDCPYVIEFFWDNTGCNSGIKEENYIGGKEGTTGAGGQGDAAVNWDPPPGEYCVFARMTIQGKTIIENINHVKVKKKPAGGAPPPPPPPPPPPFPPPWPPFPGGWWVVPVPILPHPSCTDTMRIVIVPDTSAWPAFLSKDTLFYPCPGNPIDTVWLMVWVPDETMKKRQAVSTGASTTDTSKYTIVIIDSAGVVTGSSTYFLMKTDGAPAIAQYNATAGWNLLSLPLTVADGRKSILYPTAISDAFAYQAEYTVADTMFPGTGYWLKFDSSEAINISGYIDLLDTVDVTVGWNMIGTLSDTVYTSSIVQNPSGNVTSDYFYYDGGYQTTIRLEPGKGYWVKTSSAGELILSYSSWPKIAASPVSDLRRGFNTLTIADAGGHKQMLYFGNTPDKEFSLDRYAIPPLPPEEMFDVRFASQRMLEVYPGELKGRADFPISVRAGVPPYSVSWQINNSGGARYSVEFSGTNKSFNSKILNDKGTIVVQDLSRFTLSVENGKHIPTDFAIREGYPNPFNPISTIEFDLPTSGNVELKVYDVLGQEVASLLDNVAYAAGSYSVRFDASTIASGAYFYRMNVYSSTGVPLFQSTKKTLLVR
jgi:Tol biopolymer transport system component